MVSASFNTLACLLSLVSITSAFTVATQPQYHPMSTTSALKSMSPSLVEPTQRDSQYGANVAQYLLDLHDNKATFDFCGGMMFQLVLTDDLKSHLTHIANTPSEPQPTIFDASHRRMFNLPNYAKNADADNLTVFHGRELRQIPDAAGGMGFALQLSLANGNDKQGWSKEEIGEYDGWGHDVGRNWRKADIYEAEGFQDFKERFSPQAFGLHHRCYLHFDSANRMWLSAEDGCEGTPSAGGNAFSRFFGF